MCKKATARVLGVILCAAAGLRGQSQTDWRRVGNTTIDRSLAGLATGPVDRVSYSADGSRLRIHTLSGRQFETTDFETWVPAAANSGPEAVRVTATPVRLPEPGARPRTNNAASPRNYAFGRFVYRSDDSGASWDNLTAFKNFSIVGDDLRDLAVSPRNEDEIVVAGGSGVFRSMDGGRSWSGLNQGLANLPAARLLNLPLGARGARLQLNDGSAVEWEPGQKAAWKPADDPQAALELQIRQILSLQRGVTVSAIATSGNFTYAGTDDGKLSVTADGGVTWRNFSVNGGAVERLWIDSADPRVALAALHGPGAHVVRTQNGGVFWDDLTSNLPDVPAHGVAADRATGAVYVATDRGVFMSYEDLGSLGVSQPWTALAGLPNAAAMDVRLDAQGNQLWAAVDGYGVYASLAPHRLRDPKVVSSADLAVRATAPGALVTVLGAKVQNARAGDLAVPVLDANDSQSQLQIPFDAKGATISLAADQRALPTIPLETTAPSIFVDRDGSPMLLDAETGTMLDAMTPAHSGSRVVILATGLGKVRPDWPTGLPAPVDNPPQVVAPVAAYLDRAPVEVTRAVLSPYIGFYLIEIDIPKIVNYGPAELYIQAGNQPSNRVRVYIEP